MPSVLITGANRGLGLEFARQYLADGWWVYAACRDAASASELRRLAEDSNDKLRLLAMDVTDPASIQAAATGLGGQATDASPMPCSSSLTEVRVVEDAYEFIVGSFEEEGLKPPTKAKLVKAVRKAQEEGKIDWIFEDVLEGGEKSMSEEQWHEICRKMRLAKIEPPSRAKLDREISRRLK